MPQIGARPHWPWVSPSLVDSAAMRMSQPSANSRPPVKQWPWRRAIVGWGRFSNASTVSGSKWRLGARSPGGDRSEIVAGAERAPGALEHHAADRLVGGDGVDVGPQRHERRGRHRVELVGPVQRQASPGRLRRGESPGHRSCSFLSFGGLGSMVCRGRGRVRGAGRAHAHRRCCVGSPTCRPRSSWPASGGTARQRPAHRSPQAATRLPLRRVNPSLAPAGSGWPMPWRSWRSIPRARPVARPQR